MSSSKRHASAISHGIVVDCDVDAELSQRDHHVGIEFRDRHRPQHDLAEMAVARRDPQHMIDEIELDLEARARRPGSARWSARAR